MATFTRILEGEFKPLGHFRTAYDAVLKAEHTLEDALKPEYWANVARRLKPFDKIALLAEDGSCYAEVIVAASGVGFAKVEMLYSVDLTGKSDEVPAEAVAASVAVKYRGPKARYSVIRLADKTVLQDGFQQESDAQGWMRDYLKTIAA